MSVALNRTHKIATNNPPLYTSDLHSLMVATLPSRNM